MATQTVNFYLQAADSVDLWLTEDPPHYQPLILESNQNETYSVKNVELKTSREKKRKTKDGEVTSLIFSLFFCFGRIISGKHFKHYTSVTQKFPTCPSLLPV